MDPLTLWKQIRSMALICDIFLSVGYLIQIFQSQTTLFFHILLGLGVGTLLHLLLEIRFTYNSLRQVWEIRLTALYSFLLYSFLVTCLVWIRGILILTLGIQTFVLSIYILSYFYMISYPPTPLLPNDLNAILVNE